MPISRHHRGAVLQGGSDRRSPRRRPVNERRKEDVGSRKMLSEDVAVQPARAHYVHSCGNRVERECSCPKVEAQRADPIPRQGSKRSNRMPVQAAFMACGEQSYNQAILSAKG
jgi:hypothetical protein